MPTPTTESTSQPMQYPVKKIGSYYKEIGWTIAENQGSECEFLKDYTNEGLCPVLINDVLSGRDLIHNEKSSQCSFKIVGKLGWGSYSTVWLGRETNSGEYLALKVLRREHSTLDNIEMSILRKLEKLEAAFFHTHDQAQFLCLGLKPLGCTLRERTNAGVKAPSDLPSLTMFMKTLLTKVLDFHQKRICHGDISINNVCLGVHSEAFTDQALREALEPDLIANVLLSGVPNLNTPPPRPTNLPEYIVVRWGDPLKTNAQDMSLVDIIDFGKGFETSLKSNALGTQNYCAPEVERSRTATAESDLWSLGCVFAYAPTDSWHLFSESSLTDYLAADHETQLSFIESHISRCWILPDEPEYFRIFARVIHSLVRVDPKERNPKEAMRLIKQLEDYEARQ